MQDSADWIDQVPLLYVDVETTGLRPGYGDRVCEIAALRCLGGKVVDAVQHLVNPGRPVSPGALAVHHITDEMLADAPTFADVAKDLLLLLDGAVLVGHNTPFDLGFVSSELDLAGIDAPPVIALDTLRLARQIYKLSSYSLGNLADSLGIATSGNAHRAMADVVLTRAVFERLVYDLWGKGIRTLGEFFSAQGGVIQWSPLPNLDAPPLIREALRMGHFLYIRYVDAGGQESERLVQPLSLVTADGQLLLRAHCLLRDAPRTFRMDRVLDVDLVERFE